VIEVVKSATFDRWLRKLGDRRAAARVQVRIDRLASGNAGDVKPVGGGISELRITFGPGYRVYYLQEGQRLIVLLCGGDKSTQERDIKQAQEIATDWRTRKENDDQGR
jgi:putative addiction module killer protein